jgi:hypothetical protein
VRYVIIINLMLTNGALKIIETKLSQFFFYAEAEAAAAAAPPPPPHPAPAPTPTAY